MMAEPECVIHPGPRAVFDTQAAAVRREPAIPYEKRMHLLCTIEKLIIENDRAICDAISADFGNRSTHETRILEISGSLLGLRYTRSRLKKWMKPQKRHVSLLFAGSRNRVIPQAKGIVGIITPWNYPLFLCLSPMTSAIAAGNRVMAKLATHSQNLCRLLHRIFSERIDPEYICFCPGAAASEFSGLPFNHLVFTGSPEVGKTVMKTASANLTPVTLELGGKSPTVIAADYPLKKAVARIMYAKLMNAGQTCIAPDYVFVPEDKLTEFVQTARAIVKKRYPDIRSRDYTSIIDTGAFARLIETREDALALGAKIINLLDGPLDDPVHRKISPTLVTGVSRRMRIMREEIFGPLFPVIPYTDPEEVIACINDGERPLAFYLFSHDRLLVNRFLSQTISGGVTLNDCAMHVAQHDMPFGGIGNSGMGHYHGYEGFAEMSKLRPVFRQSDFALNLAPPYGRLIEGIYRTVKNLRWLS